MSVSKYYSSALKRKLAAGREDLKKYLLYLKILKMPTCACDRDHTFSKLSEL